MIIVVAALGFENQADRDHAVAITAEVQLATREQEAGCIDYCLRRILRCRPVSKFMNCGRIVTPCQPL